MSIKNNPKKPVEQSKLNKDKLNQTKNHEDTLFPWEVLIEAICLKKTKVTSLKSKLT
jgi:hypothetical protein